MGSTLKVTQHISGGKRHDFRVLITFYSYLLFILDESI